MADISVHVAAAGSGGGNCWRRYRAPTCGRRAVGENYAMRHSYLPLHMLTAEKNAMDANRVNVTVVAVCRTI